MSSARSNQQQQQQREDIEEVAEDKAEELRDQSEEQNLIIISASNQVQQHEQPASFTSDSSPANPTSAQRGASINDAAAAADGSIPRRPRPLRPQQQQLIRRGQLVSLATGGSFDQAPPGGHVVITTTTPSVVEAYGCLPRIERATGVLQPAGRVTSMPPKRPSYLPPTRPAYRYQPATSLGATALAGGGAGGVTSGGGGGGQSGKPNRYSWAQMQQWHAAQAAAAAAAAAASGDATTSGANRAAGGGFHYHFSSPFSSAASRVLVVPNPIVNLSEHTKSRLIKFIEALKRFSEKWFSHVLLLLFLASYACLGAYVFISFEAPTEQWEKQLIIETRLRIVNESYDLAHQLSTRELYVDTFRLRFEEYERMLNRVCQSGITSSSLENQWTFWGALFYSMTVFTTIGYGHLTPITFAGRVATMIYAIFGIPILLMVLADLGKLLTRIIKYAFKKFRSLYNKLLGRKASVRTRQLISDHSNQYIGVAKHAFERGFATYIQPYQSRLLARRQQQQQSADASASIQLDAQGQPTGCVLIDQAEHMESSEVIVTPAKQTKPVSPKPEDSIKISGHPLEATQESNKKRKISTSNKTSSKRKMSISRSSSATNMTTATTTTTSNAKPADSSKRASLNIDSTSKQLDDQIQVHEHFEMSEQLEQEEQDEEYDEMDEDLDIPVSFALFLLITYMMFGAVVFSIWESWNFFDALYFVFISMSTIGFGDLVPQHPKRMIGTFAYLLFGLALTSMCINVVQEKIHATFLRAKMQIGEKMGFDLDQIMADDYYEYAGDELAGGVEQADDADTGSYAASVTAASQIYSQTDGSAAHAGDLKTAPSDPADTPTVATATPSARSKSKESLKLKKRSGSGGGASGAEQADRQSMVMAQQQQSMKRKTSASGKNKPSRQMSPAATATITPATPTLATALKPQLETIRMFNLPVHPQIEDSTSALAHPRAPPAHIQSPAAAAFCEPLRRAAQSPRPKLVASRSQPVSLVAAACSSRPATHLIAQNGQRLSATTGRRHLRHSERGPKNSTTATSTRSLGSSRRSSVSHELSQLDDLIVALSRSPPERFGPLLGIPSSARAARSATPTPTQLRLPDLHAHTANNSNRRATSMMARPASSASSTTTKTGPGLFYLGDRRKSSASSSTSRVNNNLVELNLSESQAALDELEAVKFSAV